MSWANTLVMGNTNEAFGRVTVEALTAGRPVVGANSGGTAELVHHGVDGLLFRPGDAADLARCLARLGANPEMLTEMSSIASRR